MAGGTNYAPLIDAWDAMVREFVRNIEDKKWFLSGVPAAAPGSSDPVIISHVQASDIKFNWFDSTLTLNGQKHLMVRVFRTPPPAPKPSEILNQPTPPSRPFLNNDAGQFVLEPKDVTRLSDDTILALLEEHARRVVGTPDAKLISPGKVSLLPIILRKMTHRAERGELLPRIVDEGEYLAQWIASKIDHHHPPSAGTITKTLGKNYAVLKARSTAATQ